MSPIDLDARRAAHEASRKLADHLAATADEPTPRPAIPAEHLITAPGVYDQVPAEVYHRDPVQGGSLSNSGAKLLVQPAGPARFRHWLDHPEDKETTAAMDLGSVVHQIVLGDFEDRVVVINADEWRSNAVKDEVAAVVASGRIPIKPKVAVQAHAMAASVLRNPLAAALLEPGSGASEQTMVWQDAQTGVWCRSRVDWLRDKRRGQPLVLVDFKTSATLAAPDEFGRTSVNLGYFVQDAFYSAGAVALGLDDDPDFAFVVQETKPPYLTNVLQMPAEARLIGRTYYREALRVYAECTASGVWPGYDNTDGAALVQMPGWWMRDHDEDPKFINTDQETTTL